MVLHSKFEIGKIGKAISGMFSCEDNLLKQGLGSRCRLRVGETKSKEFIYERRGKREKETPKTGGRDRR